MSSTYPPYGGTPTKPCQRCGTWLPISEPRCRNCGYDNASAQGNTVLQSQGTPWNNGIAPVSPSQGQYSKIPQSSSQAQYNSQQWGPFQQQNNMYGQPPSAPLVFNPPVQQPYTNGFQPPSAQQPFYQPSSSAMQPNGFPQGIMNTPQPLNDQSISKARRGPNIGLIVGVVILLLLLVGGGVVGYVLKSS